MKKTRIQIIIGVIAIVAVAAVMVFALWPGDKNTQHSDGTLVIPSNSSTSRIPSGTTARPASTHPTGGNVTLPTQTNPDTGKNEVSFPCTIDPFGLVIEKMAPYSGKYVEDGENATVQDVAMILVYNNGAFPVEFASLTVEFEGVTLMFDISALPAGGRAVVQEKMRRSMPSDAPTACKALVVQTAELGFASDQVEVTENADGSLTVKNLTKQTIPSIRLFYKYYLEKEQIYVGGVAFSSEIKDGLRPGSSITIRPTHYEKGSSRIVRVATYE